MIKKDNEEGTILSGDKYYNASNNLTTGSDNNRVSDIMKWYGIDSPEQVGSMQQKVIAGREAALEGNDPTSTMIKQSAGAQTRAAAATKAATGGGNLSAGERAQIQRSAQSDVNESLWKSQQSALDKYSGTATGLASNILGMDFAKQALDKDLPSGSTVICTELYRQGYLTDEIISLDSKFGYELRKVNPDAYSGYIKLATPIVRLMKKNKTFTKIVSIFGVPWANNMAYNNSLFGKIIHNIGLPICTTFGKLLGDRNATTI